MELRFLFLITLGFLQSYIAIYRQGKKTLPSGNLKYFKVLCALPVKNVFLMANQNITKVKYFSEQSFKCPQQARGTCSFPMKYI